MGNVFQEVLIRFRELLQILDRQSRLTVPRPHLDSIISFLRGDVEVHDYIWFSHKIGHVVEEGEICRHIDRKSGVTGVE